MSDLGPILHFICGKIAAGKSTLAAELGAAERTVVISEDAWLSVLFADELSSLADYVRCTSKLRKALTPHVAALLNEGVSVVLDFSANTVQQRAWMRGIIETTGASHQLHVLDVPDEVCLARLRERNARGEHPFAVTEEQYWQFSLYVTLPSPEEGFHLVVHSETG